MSVIAVVVFFRIVDGIVWKTFLSWTGEATEMFVGETAELVGPGKLFFQGNVRPKMINKVF